MNLRDEIAEIIEHLYWSTPDHRDSQSYIGADRILALLKSSKDEIATSIHDLRLGVKVTWFLGWPECYQIADRILEVIEGRARRTNEPTR